MFNKKIIKCFFIVSCLVAVVFPLLNIYVIFPSFTSLIVKNTEEDAAGVARNLSSIVVSEGKGLKSPDDFSERVDRTMEEFHLMKVKVFSGEGRVIYSTNPADIGVMNDKPYFHNVVAAGSPYTVTVKKDTRSLEDKLLKVDVVETYVPIMKGGEFLGAFEIYYNITGRNKEVNRLVLVSSLVSLFLMFLFFIAIVFVLYRADKSAEKLDAGELAMSYRSPSYLMLIVIMSLFFAHMIAMFFVSAFPPMSDLTGAMAGSALQVMMVSPMLYFFLFRPLVLHIEKRRLAEAELQNAFGKLDAANKQLKNEIAERRRIEQLIYQAKQDWEDTFNVITDMITVHDRDFNIVRANKAAKELLELPDGGPSGLKCFKYYHGMDRPPEGCPSCKCLLTHESAVFEVFEPHLDRYIEIRSIPRFDADNNIAGLIHVVRDISERKMMEERLREMSLTDELTRLYNRRGFFTLLDQRLKAVKRENGMAFLLYADLDKFKNINDTFGHHEGDRVLTNVADILRATFRETDIIARIGGDEFVVFLEGASEEGVNVVMANLRKNLSDHNARSSGGYDVLMSIGVVPYDPAVFSSVDDLLASADRLMYRQKKGRD